MKKTLLIFSILSAVLKTTLSFSQTTDWQCKTVASEQAIITDQFKIQGISPLVPSRHIVRLYFHIVRRTNGSGGLTTSQVNTALSILRNDFSNTEICFIEKGRSFVNSDYYYDFYTDPAAKFPQLINVNHQSDAINIYLLPPSGWPGAGKAQGIRTNALVVDGYMALTSVITHEVGHCLGLYHTHHGTVSEEGDPDQCPELVNGSNGHNCGDYVWDTPADPNKWSGCLYNGLVTDANGQPYNPDNDNLMSYVDPGCLDVFTSGQIERMHAMINSNYPNILDNVIVKMPVSGPEVVCSSETYTVANTPPGSTITWTASPSGIVSITPNGTSATVTKINQGHFTLKATITHSSFCNSQPIEVGLADIHAGTYTSSDYPIMGPYIANCNQYVYYYTDELPDATNYDWFWPAGWTYVSGQGGPSITLITNNNSGTVGLRVDNICGLAGSPFTKSTSITGPCFQISVYPNPARDKVNVKISDMNGVLGEKPLAYFAEKMPLIKEAHLYNYSGILIESVRYPDGNEKVVFSTVDLPAGNYIIRATDGKDWGSTNLIIQ
ncbi:putative secreted protein (Por secretion system target) [Anseongella ginsenosidimutans]|uniref:Putative secreted protein (Por secretion system target) n=1 Tax=Anseongella ginsenosidimutans TaxID=496056 RepID=A0A4R3KJ54_9SPHI|nr:M43 family zinc metalloprotease [Anseongella ginsenosidimutans]QEC53764.1 hypothetical protein FRZ59_16425 [Anseongella ginsenosidimutans]TCS83646.1 putative secreted protein (Por secretion system target) [Anseongella ginsenosidimutans]